MKAVSNKTKALLGAVILIFLITALAPSIYEQLAVLGNTTGVPTWVGVVLIVVVSAGLIFLVWNLFDTN
jgi:protein-S-isoprenylcysteine O-methyltransferase Ste14